MDVIVSDDCRGHGHELDTGRSRQNVGMGEAVDSSSMLYVLGWRRRETQFVAEGWHGALLATHVSTSVAAV